MAARIEVLELDRNDAAVMAQRCDLRRLVHDRGKRQQPLTTVLA
ncbi:hypothetical protein [Methylibium rhizosphaerae]|nr:hypothetical protein [Methylibium rhizosphaerae]